MENKKKGGRFTIKDFVLAHAVRVPVTAESNHH